MARRGGSRGMPRVVAWQPPLQPPRHSMVTPRNVNPHGPPMFTAPRLGLGLGLGFHGMPWASVEGSVVYRGRCRGRLCRRWCHGMPRHVVKKGYNVHPPPCLPSPPRVRQLCPAPRRQTVGTKQARLARHPPTPTTPFMRLITSNIRNKKKITEDPAVERRKEDKGRPRSNQLHPLAARVAKACSTS